MDGLQKTRVACRRLGGTVEVEHTWVGSAQGAPVMVFLHEGLGSVAMWRDFPEELCEATGCRGLVYSRPGYGGSTPRGKNEVWGRDFMHEQALEVLPSLLDLLEVPPGYWLLGHSDGGSIALIHAAGVAHRVGGLVVLAPHIFVEDIGLASIREAREAYLKGGLAGRLAKFHADPDSAFWGWNDAWLSEGFANWNLKQELTEIRCPVLAIQGHQDQYGSMAQIDGIVRCVDGSEALKLDNCGHSPHRDQVQMVTNAVKKFIMNNRLA